MHYPNEIYVKLLYIKCTIKSEQKYDQYGIDSIKSIDSYNLVETLSRCSLFNLANNVEIVERPICLNMFSVINPSEKLKLATLLCFLTF